MTIDPMKLRAAFGRFVTGVTVVTTQTPKGEMLGFTANSFTSVSMNPPLLLVCPGNHLSSFEAFKNAEKFGINILSEGQESVSNRFASSKGNRFEPKDWALHDGVPLIDGRAAGFVCEKHQIVEAGDHIILIGKVTAFDDAEKDGLGYGPNGYFAQSKERKAEAPAAAMTQVSALIDDGENLFLTPDFDLPSVSVPTGQSPLKTLRAALNDQGINAEIKVVYAIYDQGRGGRRIVFRVTLLDAQAHLTSHSIHTFDSAASKDAALASLLGRFQQEFRTQNFGFYLGDEQDGDIMPVKGG